MAKVAYARGPDVAQAEADKDEDYPIVSPGEATEDAPKMMDMVNGVPCYDTRLYTPLGGIPVPRVDQFHALTEQIVGEYDIEKHLCNLNVVNSNPAATFGVLTSPEFLMTLAANPTVMINPVKCTQQVASFVEDKLNDSDDFMMDEDEEDEKDMDHEVPCNAHDTVLPDDDDD